MFRAAINMFRFVLINHEMAALRVSLRHPPVAFLAALSLSVWFVIPGFVLTRILAYISELGYVTGMVLGVVTSIAFLVICFYWAAQWALIVVTLFFNSRHFAIRRLKVLEAKMSKFDEQPLR